MSLGDIFAYAAYGAAGLAAIKYASTCLFMVRQREEGLITAFGKHVRTEQKAGLHMKKPWPFNVVAAKVSTALQQITDELKTKTKDDVFVTLPVTIQYEVNNTGRYYFDTDKPVTQVKSIVNAALRNYASDKEFQKLYDDRDEISETVIRNIASNVEDYGIILRRIVIDEPKPAQEVENAYNRVRASEREREAARNEAEADYIKRVREAEADKERNDLIGQGVAAFRRNVFEGYADQIKKLEEAGITPDQAAEMVKDTMRLDTLRDVGQHGNLVYVVEGGNGDKGVGQRIADMHTFGNQSPTRTPANDKKSGKGGNTQTPTVAQP